MTVFSEPNQVTAPPEFIDRILAKSKMRGGSGGNEGRAARLGDRDD